MLTKKKSAGSWKTVKESGLLDFSRGHVQKCIKQICFQVEKKRKEKTCDQRTNNSVSNARYLWQIWAN